MTKPEERTSRHKGKAGLARIWRALFYSFAGLTSAFRKESAFRQELALAVVLVLIAVALPATLCADRAAHQCGPACARRGATQLRGRSDRRPHLLRQSRTREAGQGHRQRGGVRESRGVCGDLGPRAVRHLRVRIAVPSARPGPPGHISPGKLEVPSNIAASSRLHFMKPPRRRHRSDSTISGARPRRRC